MKYFVKTFGCQANTADSERIAAGYQARGFTLATGYADADHVIINTCMVRQSAENRVYGLVNQLAGRKKDNPNFKIIVTGCLVGLVNGDKSGRLEQLMKKRMPAADEFLPMKEVGFDQAPLRTDPQHAWVVISHGCNNYCTFCIVPHTRGPEVSRPFEEILQECRQLKTDGYQEVTLLGQNVNSYGADLIKDASILLKDSPPPCLSDGEAGSDEGKSFNSEKSKVLSRDGSLKLEIAGRRVSPIMVKHLGKYRIPTLFPHLIEELARLGFSKINFFSSNPWDFSSALIEVIARNPNITREIHLPVQSGDDEVLRKMNRWYTRNEYLELVSKLKLKIKNSKLTTDIIVGFPGETEEQFLNTVKLAEEVNFEKAYIAMYSPRPETTAAKSMVDDVPYLEKKRRWQILEDLINKPHLTKKDVSH